MAMTMATTMATTMAKTMTTAMTTAMATTSDGQLVKGSLSPLPRLVLAGAGAVTATTCRCGINET